MNMLHVSAFSFNKSSCGRLAGPVQLDGWKRNLELTHKKGPPRSKLDDEGRNQQNRENWANIGPNWANSGQIWPRSAEILQSSTNVDQTLGKIAASHWSNLANLWAKLANCWPMLVNTGRNLNKICHACSSQSAQVAQRGPMFGQRLILVEFGTHINCSATLDNRPQAANIKKRRRSRRL